MPLNRSNPAYGRPVPPGFPAVPPYITAAGVPTNDPGTEDTPTPQPQPAVTNVDIAPAGSAAAPTPAPAPASTAAAGPPSPGQKQSGGYTVDQIIAPYQDELLTAHTAVSTIQNDINKAQARIDYLTTDPTGKQQAVADPTLLTAATSEINAKYGAMSSALGRVQTANSTLATATTNALHDGTVDPSQVQVANATVGKANADAAEAIARATVLLEGSDNQKALTAAQASLASANAGQAEATAAATRAKTPAEIAQLNAQATALQQQAASTQAMIQPLVDKTNAETKLLGSQSDVAQSQVTLTNAQAASQTADVTLKNATAALTQGQLTAGLPGAQVAQAAGAGAQSQAAAAASLAGIEKDKLGPLYGLQDQIKAIQAIQQQVFGPGGSGNPQDANDLLSQFTQAQVAGTTPYAANVAAANAGLTAFGTQASLANAAQGAMATRASALTGASGTALGALLGVMKDAPKGFGGLGAAFSDVMNALGQNAQKYAPPPTTPTAPPLPALLQRLAPGGAPGGVGGLAPTGGPGMGATAGGVPGLTGMPTGPANVPPPTASTPTSVLPAAAAAAAPPMPTGPTGAPPTNAPVTINIGGSSPNQVPGQNYGAATAFTGGVAPTGGMPALLQQHAPPTTDFVHQLWGNELGSGAVTSPYAGVGTSPSGGAAPITPSAPTPMPVMGQAA